ncbi:hypothetical protein Tco_0797869 [Tanacetum coccineum]
MVDAHLGTRLGDSIQKALRSYTVEFEKEAQAEKKRYIDLIEKSVKDIINDEVKTQLPQILPKTVSDFTTPVIKSTVTESLEDVVLAKSSSQPQSTYEAAASLTEFELKKILIDKMEKTVSLKRGREDKDKDEDPPAGSDQGMKRRKTSKDVESSKGSKSKESKSTKDPFRQDAKKLINIGGAKDYKEFTKKLVKSYKLDKDLFESYGKAYSIKRDREDKDKDVDPSAGSDQGMKRRKTRKEAKSSKGSKSKDSKSTSSSKGTIRSQPKSSGKSTQAEEPIQITVEDHWSANRIKN